MGELVDGDQHIHIGQTCDHLLLERYHTIVTGARTCPFLLLAQQKNLIRIQKLLGWINLFEKTGHV